MKRRLPSPEQVSELLGRYSAVLWIDDSGGTSVLGSRDLTPAEERCAVVSLLFLTPDDTE